jgi:hypothetical protein
MKMPRHWKRGEMTLGSFCLLVVVRNNWGNGRVWLNDA